MVNARISVNTKRGIVRISRGAVKALGDPVHIRLLIDKDAHQAAIQKAAPSDRDRIRVPYEEGRQFRFQINSKAFTESLSDVMGWDQSSTFQVNGEIEDDLIVFNFDGASRVGKDSEIEGD